MNCADIIGLVGVAFPAVSFIYNSNKMREHDEFFYAYLKSEYPDLYSRVTVDGYVDPNNMHKGYDFRIWRFVFSKENHDDKYIKFYRSSVKKRLIFAISSVYLCLPAGIVANTIARLYLCPLICSR